MAEEEPEVKAEPEDAPEAPEAPPPEVLEKSSAETKERPSIPEARVSQVSAAAAAKVSAGEIPAAEVSVAADTEVKVEAERRLSSTTEKKIDSAPPSRRPSMARKSIDLVKEKSKSQTGVKTKSDTKQFAGSKAEIPGSKEVISTQESKRSIMSLGPRTSKDISRDVFTRRKSSRSIGKAVGSIISFRRGSIAEYFDRQKTAKFMNTYKLDSEKPFNVDKVEKILKEVLIEALDNLTYDSDKVPKQAKWASSVIRAKVKEQEYDRYKLICNVTIGEKRSQDMYATYRFLWDAERDKHACYVHENMYLFAFAMCFGVYYE